jgi:nucleotide-binding universal stress UspA family protein
MDRVSKVVVGIDFGEESQRALSSAIEIADADGGELHALYVDQPPVDVANAFALPPPPRLEEDLARLREMVSEAVRLVVARRGKLGLKHVTVHGTVGAPASEIARFAAEIDADIVVVGTHGRRGLDRAFLGSVAEKTIRLCGCPVLVIREKKHPTVEKIPEIEPPCPDCVQRRFETKGEELWCARHTGHHPKAHVYSYEGPSSDSARPWGFTS